MLRPLRLVSGVPSLQVSACVPPPAPGLVYWALVYCDCLSFLILNLSSPGCSQCHRYGIASFGPDCSVSHLRYYHLRHHWPRDVHGGDAQSLFHQRYGYIGTGGPKVGDSVLEPQPSPHSPSHNLSDRHPVYMFPSPDRVEGRSTAGRTRGRSAASTGRDLTLASPTLTTLSSPC